MSMSNCPQVNRPRYLTLKDDMQKPDFLPLKKLKAKLTELDTVNCTINTILSWSLVPTLERRQQCLSIVEKNNRLAKSSDCQWLSYKEFDRNSAPSPHPPCRPRSCQPPCPPPPPSACHPLSDCPLRNLIGMRLRFAQIPQVSLGILLSATGIRERERRRGEGMLESENLEIEIICWQWFNFIAAGPYNISIQ